MGMEKSEEKRVKKEEPGNKLDNDTLRKLVNEEITFDDITPDQRLEFHKRFVEGGEEGVPTVEEEAAAKAATPPATQTPPGVIQPSVIVPNVNVAQKKPEEADKSEILAKLKSEKDANNTLKQQLENAQRKLDSLQNSRVPEPPKIEDALDDNLTKQDKWNRSMAAKLNTHVDNEISNIQKSTADTKQKLLYSDVSLLQAENPELQTSQPIESIDRAYIRFRDTLAGGPGATNQAKNEAVNNFFSNADFRKSKEAEGHLFPINDADWKNYKTVSQVISYKRNGGTQTWDSKKGDKFQEIDVAYYKYKKDNGIIPDPVQRAAIEAATKVFDQVAS